MSQQGPYLVMDLVEGESLQTAVKQTGPFPPQEALRILRGEKSVAAAETAAIAAWRVFHAGDRVGAIIFDFVCVMFNFLRMGTTGLTAQAFGAGDRQVGASPLDGRDIAGVSDGHHRAGRGQSCAQP